LDHLNFHLVIFLDRTTYKRCKGDGVLICQDHGEEFGSSIPRLPKASIWDPLQGEYVSMINPTFTYNNPDASCALCDRTKNPHPDYSHEPIVTTRLELRRGDQDLCINCYWEIVALAMNSQANILDIVNEKLNMRRLITKNAPSTSERYRRQSDDPNAASTKI
jgi:hypothetical protein